MPSPASPTPDHDHGADLAYVIANNIDLAGRSNSHIMLSPWLYCPKCSWVRSPHLCHRGRVTVKLTTSRRPESREGVSE